jgi:hypothetical protein
MKNESKTIVHLADNSPEVVLLINRLVERGWNVHLVCYDVPPKKALDPRVHVHKLPIATNYPFTYAAFLVAAPMILRIKPDILHAHYLTRSGILAAVYRRFLRFKPMVLTACGDDVLVDSRGGMIRWAAEHALKMFETITCSSGDIANGLADLEAPIDRIELVDFNSKGTSEAAVEKLETTYTGLINRHGKRASTP